jgi:hypothetical protein
MLCLFWKVKVKFLVGLMNSIVYKTTASYNRLQEEVETEKPFYSAKQLFPDMKIVFSACPKAG